MADNPYTGKHRSGQGSPGYSRGNREKPKAASEEPGSAQLGLMTAGNIMSYHEHNRQREYNIDSANKNMAKAAHPSAGSRSAEFAQYAVDDAKAAGAAYANMRVAGRTTTPRAFMHGRQVHFDLGRRAGFSGLN